MSGIVFLLLLKAIIHDQYTPSDLSKLQLQSNPKSEFHFWHTIEHRECLLDELKNSDIPCEVKLGNAPNL